MFGSYKNPSVYCTLGKRRAAYSVHTSLGRRAGYDYFVLKFIFALALGITFAIACITSR